MTTLAEAARALVATTDDLCSLTACRDPLHKGPCKGWRAALKAGQTLGEAAQKKPRAPRAPKAAKGDALRIAAAVQIAKGSGTHSEKLAAIERLTHGDFEGMKGTEHRAVRDALSEARYSKVHATRESARKIHQHRYGDFGVGTHAHKVI